MKSNKFLATNITIALVAMVIIVYFYPHPEANHYKFEEGRPWNYTKLIAPFDIPIKPDSATVLRVRDSLDRSFIPVFERQPSIADSVITSLMAKWVRADDDGGTSTTDANLRKKAVTFLRSAYSKDVIDDEYGKRITDGSLPAIKILHENTVRQTPTSGITYPEKIIAEMSRAIGDSVGKDWLERYDVASLLRPNMVYNQETSKRLYDYELYRFTAIQGVIQQGQTIIDKGAVITPQDYTNLKTYEAMVDEQLTADNQSKWLIWLGQLLYVSILLGALMVYLRFSSPGIWEKRLSMMFVFILIVVFFLIGIGLESFLDMGIYLVPFAIVPVLMIVFFDAATALFVSMVLTMLCAGVTSFTLEFIMLQVTASVAAVYSLRQLSQRSQLLRTSIFVAISYCLAYVSLELMMNGSLSGLTGRMFIFLLINSAITSIAYILMVVVERVFGFVSVVTLSELTDINNPLLRKLSEECPGTFQHSMAVSTLAADAAMKIGANEQLVRAGALYHDIGKITNPNFFTENQHGVNPHDALPAQRSAEIIIEHVTDGLRRAEKAGLPDIIKDFIAEHHGKGKAKYFYYTYCNQHPDEDVDPKPFTYPGPNPRSRETSVMMMADSVEAASRSLQEHTPQAIADLVNKIIDGQIADGLHNDSTLSFRDVKIIKETFIKRLMTMYHSRIIYPDGPNKK